MFKKLKDYFTRNKKYDDLLEKYNDLKGWHDYEVKENDSLKKENISLSSENNKLIREYKKICYEFKEEGFRKQIYPNLEGMKYILNRFNIESGDIDYCLLKNVVNNTYRVLVKAKNQFGFDKEFHLCKEEYEAFFRED